MTHMPRQPAQINADSLEALHVGTDKVRTAGVISEPLATGGIINRPIRTGEPDQPEHFIRFDEALTEAMAEQLKQQFKANYAADRAAFLATERISMGYRSPADRRTEVRIQRAKAPHGVRFHWLRRWRWDVTYNQATSCTHLGITDHRVHLVADHGYTLTTWGAYLAAGRKVRKDTNPR